MEEIKTTAYKAIDGKTFTDKAGCLAYEKELKSRQLWRVTHSPDCTEGRGYHRCTYLHTKNAHINEVEDFCFNQFGAKSAYVMGVSFIPAWFVKPVEDPENHTKTGNGIGLHTGKFGELTLVRSGKNPQLIVKE